MGPTVAEHQVWEQRVAGSDVVTTRLHLEVDETGRARVHEAVLAQLLDDAGWERADDAAATGRDEVAAVLARHQRITSQTGGPCVCGRWPTADHDVTWMHHVADALAPLTAAREQAARAEAEAKLARVEALVDEWTPGPAHRRDGCGCAWCDMHADFCTALGGDS